MDSGPFQVMFVPLRSKTLASSRAAVAAHQYSMWAIKALRAAGGSGESDAPAKPTNKAPTVKKATATDTATARMQLDAAAAQAAAMAIRQQREKAAAAEVDIQNNILNSDSNVKQQQQQLNDVDNDPIGGLHALDDFEEGAAGERDYATAGGGADNLGDFTDDFEGMNSDSDVLHSGTGGGGLHGENGGQILNNNNINNVNVDANDLLNSDDYSGADDFKTTGGGANDAGGAILEAAENDYHHRAQKLEENPFGDGDDDGQNAAAHAAGVA